MLALEKLIDSEYYYLYNPLYVLYIKKLIVD